MNENTIKLYRYSSSWQELPTACIGENATHRFYRATTSGFSIFAIVGQPRAQPPAVAQPSTGQPDIILLTLLTLLVGIVCVGTVSLFRPSKGSKPPKVSKRGTKPEVAPLKPPKKLVKVRPEAKSKIGADYLKHMMPIAKELVAAGKFKSGRDSRSQSGRKRSKR